MIHSPISSHTIWSNLPRPELMAMLTQAQKAYAELLCGAKVVSVSYSQETGAKSVTYSQADRNGLLGLIMDLQRTLGINRRRAIGIRFR
ncbi:gpW family head-tail joining protein [Entomobacter blattae]|uniref:Phage head-tail adapter protein n=1 Tax=Entomobacter blattae TaxID=2762277 RepID=A0A7H1NUH1_9PROT|nr:gpW family head-tail joining protein [Entomobacter blattae]QNT79431.1 hypothetical protein JGUZn3_22300 [Entomobacter blattae]